MSYKLQNSSVRNELEPRTEPYWGAPIATGRFVGLRKINAATASWIARMRVEDVGDQVRHKYKALGVVSAQFDYDAAKAAAAEWFRQIEAAQGTTTDVLTVADACRAYLAELRAGKRDATAHDAERRFERTVYGRKVDKARGMAPDAKEIPPDPIAGVHLSKLTVKRLKDWRNDLPTKNLSTANRTLTALKAALNLAVTNNPALATRGLEWSAVTPHEIKEDTRRKLVLDLKQRRALVAAAKGPVRDLIRAASLTGARAGELTSATVSQFNPRERELTLTGKTGTRTVKLSTAAAALFRRLAKGKKPTDRLLTREERRAWAHSDWDGLIKDAAKAAKLPADTCLYTLRHTWISEQIAGGMTTLDVARLCGTSLVMIEQHYGKTSKDVQQRLNRVAML
jgi:site-specific recombinase XerD